MSPGHFGPSLAAKLTGSNAFVVICRLDLEMGPHSVTGFGSSDLIGAWRQAPSQFCPLTQPVRHR